MSNVPTQEFLRAFVRKDELSVDGKNVLCNSDLYLSGLGVEKIPDLSEVHISGKFLANDINRIDMRNLPYADGGYSLSHNTVINNCDKIDAETFCQKIGMKYKNGLWYQDGAVNNARFSGCPKGLSELNIKDLNFIHLSVDNIDELPISANGANRIKIADQSSIKNMDAHVFLQKIVGHAYDKYPNMKYNEHYNIDLDLSGTNITELPKGLDKYNINRIIFPQNANPVHSLENIPVTKDGCYNLNFKGDLSNETMESFLQKTKGRDWCAKNISKAADGHLIIAGNIDFNTQNWSAEKVSELDISSFPKDIENVEFKGSIEPIKLRESLRQYKELASKKNATDVYISNNHKLKYDLSDFKAEHIHITDNFSSVRLPETVKEVSFSNLDNSDFSKINLDNVKSVHLLDVKSANSLDLSRQANVTITRSNIDAVQFPEKCESLSVTDSKFGQTVEFPKEAAKLELHNVTFDKGVSVGLNKGRVELGNCHFPEGATLDLSHCSYVSLSDVDLSRVKIKFPETGTIHIHENVKFAPDCKLDFSKCRDATVHKSVECAEILLPQRGEMTGNTAREELPKQVKEVTTEYIKNHQTSVPDNVKIIDAPMKNGKRVSLESLSRAGLSQDQIKSLRKERLLEPFQKIYKKISGKNDNRVQANPSPAAANKNEKLCESLKAQQSSYQKKIAAISDGIDHAFEKGSSAINDNAVGRAVNRIDSWRPHNKLAAKAMDKTGVVPVAAVVGSGVAAYEQYKSGDAKGAAATLGKGAVHASVYGAATAVGMNIAAKGAAKASEKITAKVIEKKAAKTASKAVAKAAGKAAGKAVGKSVLKKIPLVSLGAGAYFAYERAKNGDWGKAGCELLSGALGCFPGLGTVASTAVDCGLAAADVKQSINETKKRQAAAPNKPRPVSAADSRKNAEIARKIRELRSCKTEKGCQRLADRRLLTRFQVSSVSR